VVLWAAVWGQDSLERLGRLINSTWLVVILATALLFVAASLYLDLGERILHPSSFLECRPGHWYDLTGGRLRGTGVGRYAAIAGIVSISALWQRSWRPVWIVILVTSVLLLLFSGARGSFGGFAVGASLTFLLHGGKRGLLAGALAILIVVPLFWSTHSHETFLKNCLFRSSSYSSVSASKALGSAVRTLTPSFLTSGGTQDSLTSSKDTAPEDGGTVKDPVSTEQQAPLITKEFFTFTGRTAVWAEGLKLLKNSPFIGFGFHSDRLMLGTHMHNSVMQALFQAGFLGAIPFVAAIIFGWVLLARIVRNLAGMPTVHKHLVIQSGGVFAFFTMRSLPESTGTFFGIDWLILALILLYLHLVNEKQNSGEAWA
jgi:hypothetical protein